MNGLALNLLDLFRLTALWNKAAYRFAINPEPSEIKQILIKIKTNIKCFISVQNVSV